YALLDDMSNAAATNDAARVDNALVAYGHLQGEKAVNIASHSHMIEFGMLAILMAFFQPYVAFSEKSKRKWALVMLLGSLTLPVFVELELRGGLIAGGIADFGGVLVIIGLFAMWIGVLRYSGILDATTGSFAMRDAQ